MAALPILDLVLYGLGVRLTIIDEIAIGLGAIVIAVCVMARFFGLVRLTGDLVEAQASRRTEALVRESQDVIAIIGPDRRSTYVSPAIERVLGWSPEIAVGLPLETLVYPEDRALVVEYFEDAVAVRTHGTVDLRDARHDPRRGRCAHGDRRSEPAG